MTDKRFIVKYSDSEVAIALILFTFFITASFAILSRGSFGGEDDISHYKIARYAYEQPKLFLDLWGKPVFTILAAPFAQLGYNGIRIFNTILSALTCWFSFLILQRFKVQYGWSVVLLIAFAPLYFVMSYTGMTEILFGFILIFSIWMLASGRSLAAVIILSFLPFVRSEGFIIWIPFIAGFIISKKFRVIPFFLTATLIFSLPGTFVFNDWLWIINYFPYKGASDIYGEGSLFHFVRAIPRIFGIALFLLSSAGLLSMIIKTREEELKRRRFFFVWYVIFPAILYFGAHSFVWWKGIGSSAGLTRVMAGIIPSVGLAGGLGIDWLAGALKERKAQAKTVIILILIIAVSEGYRCYPHPTPLTADQQLIREATDWISTSQFKEHKIYYYNPLVYKFLRLNPYDSSMSQEKVPDAANPGRGLFKGDIVVWDSHFGPNEGHLTLTSLSASPLFRELVSFSHPDNEQLPASVVIFERVEAGTNEGRSTSYTEFNSQGRVLPGDTIKFYRH